MSQLAPTALNTDQTLIEEVVVQSAELTLELTEVDDADLLAVLQKKIDESTKHYKDKLKLPTRRETNRNYWLGKQHEGKPYYDWQVPYTDNIIYRDTETRIAIAAGRMPDIVVIPENENDKSASADAHEYEDYLSGRVNSDITKRIVKNVLRDREIKLLGAVKIRWDENRGAHGDFTFERVRPENLVIDHTAIIPDDGFSTDDMSYISEWLEEPVSLIMAKFPEKRNALATELGIVSLDKASMLQMASKIRYRETWFTWYTREGERIEGVMWHYKNTILKKMRSPYWDWKEDRNHFDMPRKPYMVTSYQNLGDGPIDDTSAIEQSIPMQDIVNRRGMQITEINDRTVPKMVISGTSMTKEQAEDITPDPNEAIYLDGQVTDVREAVAFSSAPPASQSLYQDQAQARASIDNLFATHPISRGESQSGDESGFSKQITREGDLTIADDIVQIVIERLVSEMANWATQMMMIFYYDPNSGLNPNDEEDAKKFDFSFKAWSLKHPGKDGDHKQIRMTRDKIRKGLGVVVRSSSVDKPTQRSIFMNLAGQKGVDLFSLYDALDLPNPKALTERMLAFLNGGGPNGDGFASYMKVLDIEPAEPAPAPGGATDASGNPVQNPNDEVAAQKSDQDQAIQDIQTVAQGQVPSVPETPTPEYVNTIQAFVNSPQFSQLPEEAKQALVAYIDQLHKMVDQLAQQPEPPVQ